MNSLLAAIFLYLCCTMAQAGPLRAICPDLSNDERATAKSCDSNADCTRIADQYASCPQFKAWLSAVAPADGRHVNSFDVVRALARARSPFISDADAASRYAACTGIDFQREACRAFLGLPSSDGVPLVRSDPALPAERVAVDQLLRDIVALRTNPRAAGRGEILDALAACEAARDKPDRDALCQRAHALYQACRNAQNEWQMRRNALVAQISARQPGVGSRCTKSPIRGVDDASSTPADVWDCTVRLLSTTAPATCPGVLPQSFQTPLQALAAWNAQARSDATVAGASGASAHVTASADRNIASSLFEQSTEQASRVANDPNASARLAAAAKQRESEVNQLINDGLQRQSAILGNFASNLVSSAQAGTLRETYGSGTGGLLDTTTRTLQQSAATDGGITALVGPPPAAAPVPESVPLEPIGTAPGNESQSCAQGQAAVDKEFDEMATRKPASPSMVEQLQQIMYMIERAMAQLKSAACVSDPAAKSKLGKYKESFDSSQRTCQQIASNPAVCGPKRNW